jgi:hypothetical protein
VVPFHECATWTGYPNLFNNAPEERILWNDDEFPRYSQTDVRLTNVVYPFSNVPVPSDFEIAIAVGE